jgi:perosamine synthetase
VVLEGFEPVFVDVRQNGNLDPDGLEKSYSEDVKALLIVHLHGQTVDVERIAQFCHKHGLRLIEDASQATGASFLGGKVGSFGNISAFSLYATKNLTTGEGGNNGFYQGEIEEPIGDSFRMSDIHASIGIYYLNHLDELNSKRREIAKYYSERIRKLSMLILPSPENNVFHHYNILVKRDFPFLFQKAHLFFHEKGIRIKQYYPYTLSSLLKSNSSKTASFLTKNTFSIPIYPSLQEDEIKKVADAVIDYFGGIKS